MKFEFKKQKAWEIKSMLTWLTVIIGIEAFYFMGSFYLGQSESKKKKKESEERISKVMILREQRYNYLKIKRNDKNVAPRIDLSNLNQSKRPKKRR